VRTRLDFPNWPRFATGVVLLLAEVAALTPWVEFTAGPIQYLASARLCTGLLFAIVTLGFLTDGGFNPQGNKNPALESRWIPVRLMLNVFLYAGFFWFTLWLSRNPDPADSGWPLALLWLAWALGVGASCFLSFCSWSELAFVRKWPGRLLIACSVGVSLVALTPWIWNLWPWACQPAMRLDQLLLRWSPGEAVFGFNVDGFPVLGTPKLLLLITPQCSELDALLAFWLLCGTMMVARWRTLSLLRCIVVLAIGTVLLYFLMALRLYGLVALGLTVSPRAAVDLAHSRVGSIILLSTAIALTWLMLHCCRRPCTSSLST
jgi:exosortase/archaeosortase family protein